MRRVIGANSNLLPIDHDLFATGVFANGVTVHLLWYVNAPRAHTR